MNEKISNTVNANQPNFQELFTPKLVTYLREQYGIAQFRADLIAGLTVAIVALPLSMAIAIASGVTPEKGLFTAIVGGFLVSALGGSRFQIGGPAGAFIVLITTTVEMHGIDGLVVATMISGLFLLIAGYLRLGNYIKFIPYPVTVGFTAGIAVVIFASQIKELLGIALPAKEPAEIIPKFLAISHASHTINAYASGLSILTIGAILLLKKWKPSWPGMLIAVLISALVTSFLNLPVETIGTKFGSIPRMLPIPGIPEMSLQKVQAVLPNAIAFALLGAIESLLSAVVADGMTGRHHRSNCELVAQGIANIGSAMFGGMCVTGTIARTATNIRAGAHSPISGILHAAFLLTFMLVAAPLASYIPLAALAAILVIVSYNMFEKHAFTALLRSSKGDALVLLTTFSLVVFYGLTEGITVGVALGSILFISRIAKTTSVEAYVPLIPEDAPDNSFNEYGYYDSSKATNHEVIIYRITGAFFFGTASTVSTALDRMAEKPKAFILDFSAVPLLDSTAANTLESISRKFTDAGIRFLISGTSDQAHHILLTHGLCQPRVEYTKTVKDALDLLTTTAG